MDMNRRFRLHGARQLPKDIQREIDHHLDLRTREFEAAGMSRDDARRAALDAFGDRGEIATAVDAIERSAADVARRRDWVGELRQDLAVGARMLWRSPSFAIVALLTLAIGIGANTAIFGVLRSVLLRPLPYPRPEQLVQVWSDARARGREQPEWLTPPDFIDWRNGNTTFSGMAGYQTWRPDLTGSGDPEAITGLLVTGSLFDVLGAHAERGRLIGVSDDIAGADRVVVISHALWMRRFGGNPTILGTRVTLNGNPWTVVGVLPESFRAPVQTAAPEIFAAVARPPNGPCGRGCFTLRVIGRMKPGVTAAAAEADLARIAARLAQEYPQTNTKLGAWVIPLHEGIAGSSRPALIALAAAVALVLLIGCVNLANLLLVRGAARGREIGVRAALGAGRGRVLRQLVTENVLLAAVGGALGFALGAIGTRALASLVPAGVNQIQDIHVDGEVLLFTIGVTLAASAIFGLIPAVHAVRPGLMQALRSSGAQAGTRGNRLRGGLVVAQLSLAVILLVAAGLLLRSFLMMQRVDLGYRTDGVYMAAIRFPTTRYRGAGPVAAAIQDVLTRLRANAAVKSAEVTDLPPLSGGDQDITSLPDGAPLTPGQPQAVWYRAVSPGYFQSMHMRIVRGRGITADDRRGGATVGVLNEEAARKYFPGLNPVGHFIATSPDSGATRFTIVGVAASVRHDGASQPYKAELYAPMTQFPSGGVTFVLEPARDAAALALAVRQALHDADPLLPLPTLNPMDQVVGGTVALPRLYATLVAIFAAAALLLAALGVYGVMAYGVSQRQREIGVRLALGAAPGGIARMVLGEGGRLAAAGLAIGLIGAMLAGQLLGKLLFGVTRFDPPTLVTVPLVLGAVTLVGCWLPARRAMRLDPLSAIREE